MIDFVNSKLLPYWRGSKQSASGLGTTRCKIDKIFGEAKDRGSSGYNLREIIENIDELHSQLQFLTLSALLRLRSQLSYLTGSRRRAARASNEGILGQY
jgi:hypothetical protein